MRYAPLNTPIHKVSIYLASTSQTNLPPFLTHHNQLYIYIAPRNDRCAYVGSCHALISHPLFHCSLLLHVCIYSIVFTLPKQSSWLALGYLLFIILDSNCPETGGRKINWVRHLPNLYWACDFFPMKLVKTCEIDPSKNYIFGYRHSFLLILKLSSSWHNFDGCIFRIWHRSEISVYRVSGLGHSCTDSFFKLSVLFASTFESLILLLLLLKDCPFGAMCF